MIKQSKIQHPMDSKHSVILPIYEEGHFCGKLTKELGYDFNEDLNKDFGEITKISTMGKLAYKSIYVIGLGKKEEITTKKLMKAFSMSAKKITEAVISVNLNHAVTDEISIHEVATVATEAIITAKYEFHKINTEKKEATKFELIASEDVSKEIKVATVIAEAINHAKTLGNMPSNYMTPIDLADYAEKLAKDCGLEVNILANKDLEKIGAGAILGVNKGSIHEARLIVLKYNGAGKAAYTALVGKGLTFDSGGYNLKPSAGMMGMKYDMCGSAAVLGAMEIIAKNKLSANVYAIIPSTENMISGEAYKCDDVLISLSGKTIEITNTDAEGRLILCDAITYATQQGAKRIVDVATLTGACIGALGSLYTGAFSNSEVFYQSLEIAAKKSHEKIWRLPLDEEYAKTLKRSLVADIVNSTGKGPGATIAAEFLHEFVEDGIEWIHLDIAGTASDKLANNAGAEGATGVMVKTLANLVEL